MKAVFSCSIVIFGLLMIGCAGPGPRTFPPAPLKIEDRTDSIVSYYDITGDKQPDFFEVQRKGRVTEIGYPQQSDVSVQLNEAQNAESPQILIILDSIPFELVQEAWEAGRFRYFFPPARIVSPFPVMTDPAIAEFFGVSPCVGVESVHFDGTKLVDGYSAYLEAENAPWLARVDYHLPNDSHAIAYLWPGMWFRRELHDIQSAFAKFPPKIDPGITRPATEFVAYCVGTSCLGSKRGRDGHHYALVELDRFCRQLIYDRNGNVQITLMSDHGHDFGDYRRIELSHELERLGYHVGKTLSSPQDVVLPEFGLVSCAAIHTGSPSQVARDCIGIDGVELAFFAEKAINESSAHKGSITTDSVVVISRDGEARINRVGDKLSYTPVRGDPLKLEEFLLALKRDPNRDPFQATLDHEYPDPLDRVWRAFHGLFKNAPDVILSGEKGAFFGSEELAKWLDMKAVHGNLNRVGSSGFIMTTRRALPSAMRMRDARAILNTQP